VTRSFSTPEVEAMAVRYQLVINCADPAVMTRFWSEALGYVLEPPPAGFDSWDDYRRHVGLVSELGKGTDSIVDPDGSGPRIWFQVSPDRKTVANRLHFDVRGSGSWDLPLDIRRERIDAEARRLCDLGATMVAVLAEEGVDWYAVAMRDPEGNEFDIN